MVKILYGEEPYIIEREKFEMADGGSFVRHQEFSAEDALMLRTPSFCGPRKMLLELESVREVNNTLINYLEYPCNGSDLIIIFRDFDEKSHIGRKMQKMPGIKIVNCKKVSRKTLQGFLLGIVRRNNKQIRQAAMDFLISRLGYVNRDVTLYTCGNLLMNLIDGIEEEEITCEYIDEYIPERDMINRFGLIPLIEKKDSAIYSISKNLTEEGGPIVFLMLLQRELRIAYKSRFYQVQEIGCWKTGFQSWSIDKILYAMDEVADIVYGLKRGAIPDSIAITECFSRLLSL